MGSFDIYERCDGYLIKGALSGIYESEIREIGTVLQLFLISSAPSLKIAGCIFKDIEGRNFLTDLSYRLPLYIEQTYFENIEFEYPWTSTNWLHIIDSYFTNEHIPVLQSQNSRIVQLVFFS